MEFGDKMKHFGSWLDTNGIFESFNIIIGYNEISNSLYIKNIVYILKIDCDNITVKSEKRDG